MQEVGTIKYYKVRYTDGTSDTITSYRILKSGRYYRLENNKETQIIKQIHCKYTYDDLETVRKLMAEYNKGSMQSRLCDKMRKALLSKVPTARFTKNERELLRYEYFENTDISDKDRCTIKKILGMEV